ncbi:hypothetical protein [Pseudomonas sp. Marseille-QA0892]
MLRYSRLYLLVAAALAAVAIIDYHLPEAPTRAQLNDYYPGTDSPL